MLKLIIADDERIIRESISTLIDWGSLGIELVGLCSDGIEAYNMILDECPDIVLTDIRMPGLSGLDLIERISQTDLNIQFVLLSGYGEFEYAKQAMRFRVHHYLLKPCNEEQIIESMKDVIQEHYHHKAFQDMKNRQKLLVSNLHHSLLSNIIHEGTFLSDNSGLSMDAYSGFMDFYNTSYELCFLHYLEESCLIETLEEIYAYMKKEAPGIMVYSIYVKNNLLLFFESYHVSYDQMDSFFRVLAAKIGEQHEVAPEYRRVSFPNLASLLETVISKVKRFGMIYFMNGLRAVPICNYKTVIARLEELTALLVNGGDEKQKEYLQDVKGILDGISSPDFLRQLGSTMIIRLTAEGNFHSPIDATEFLMKLNQQTDLEILRSMLLEKICSMISRPAEDSRNCSALIENVMQYVEENLDNPNLTLKWIAENYLFMNVDYVSKRFIKETDQKFSNYLSNLRIQKARQLLSEGHGEIQWVAQQVGCGNNPQYFSQIFKKSTGLTPSAFVKKINGGQ